MGEIMAALEYRERPRTESFRFVLRRETHSQHQALDAHPAFARLMNGTLSLGGYGRLMQLLQGFYETHDPLLSDACARYVLERFGFAYAARRHILARDVGTLGVIDPLPISARSALPPVDSGATLGGMLYVFEGSMLGGAVLCRAAESLLAKNHMVSNGYWQWCRDAGPARWAMTCAMIDGLAVQDSARSGMIEGAKAGFAGFGDWFADWQDVPCYEQGRIEDTERC
jgi:heme oxygenase